MKYSELTSLDDQALVHKELQLERDLLELRFRLKTNQLDNSAAIGRIRKDIARVRTAQRERERAQGLGSNALRNAHRSSFKAGASAADTGSSSAFLKGLSDKLGTEQE